MIQINDNLLNEIGLGTLPQTERRGLLNHIYETLELRVGMRLADQMTNEQLDEFERYFEAKDDKGAFGWLESNLKAEVAQSAPQILSAASHAPAQPALEHQPLQGNPVPATQQTPVMPENLSVPPQPPAPYPPQIPPQQVVNPSPLAPQSPNEQPPAGPPRA
jgi:hypothetical protein